MSTTAHQNRFRSRSAVQLLLVVVLPGTWYYTLKPTDALHAQASGKHEILCFCPSPFLLGLFYFFFFSHDLFFSSCSLPPANEANSLEHDWLQCPFVYSAHSADTTAPQHHDVSSCTRVHGCLGSQRKPVISRDWAVSCSSYGIQVHRSRYAQYTSFSFWY